MAVGRHHHAAINAREASLVIHLPQEFVIKCGHEQLLDQLRHRPSAAAMIHFDAAMLQVKCAGIPWFNFTCGH